MWFTVTQPSLFFGRDPSISYWKIGKIRKFRSESGSDWVYTVPTKTKWQPEMSISVYYNDSNDVLRFKTVFQTAGKEVKLF